LKKITIHAGPGKTGTSVIQYVLLNNRAFLHSNGIFYPEHSSDENNVSSGNFNRVLSKKQSKSFKIDSVKVKKLKQDFDASNCDVMLLSSEHFFPFLKQLNEVFENVTFILYLRDPIDVIESGYNQAVKRAFKTEKLNTKSHVEFRVLSLIEQFYSDGNGLDIILRPYSTQLFVHNDLISDFFHVLGLDFIIREDKLINPSYCFEALELKRQLNLHFKDKDAIKLDKALQSYTNGKKDFSLIEPDVYEALRLKVTTQLADFINSYSLTNLLPYLQELQTKTQRTFIKQHATVEEYQSVLDFLWQKDANLCQLVFNAVIDSDDIDEHLMVAVKNRSALGFLPPIEMTVEQVEDYSFISSLVEGIKNKPNINEVRFCRELGLALEQAGRIDEAVLFFKALLYFKPDAEMIKKKLKKYS
jgi:hypothetical protein